MENIIDMIAMDSEPAKISDELKDLMYQKAAKRVEDLRPEIGNVMFDEIEDETEVLRKVKDKRLINENNDMTIKTSTSV